MTKPCVYHLVSGFVRASFSLPPSLSLSFSLSVRHELLPQYCSSSNAAPILRPQRYRPKYYRPITTAPVAQPRCYSSTTTALSTTAQSYSSSNTAPILQPQYYSPHSYWLSITAPAGSDPGAKTNKTKKNIEIIENVENCATLNYFQVCEHKQYKNTAFSTSWKPKPYENTAFSTSWMPKPYVFIWFGLPGGG